ncbi:hypothetical protein [Radiobacillus deserti]|uniref:DUF4268 domain-containing protein n=1 Tax=Radiobacillus deserti TaxID=2594883 RepID=A0A516KKQ9_9BACI|nr:hypothetical protein [Radiobacillus deserti]QDP41980.1 hypothetical protein FN924_18485 [Radiobacillus deserti]
MSIGGRKEEVILTLYLKKNKKVIEELIGISIEGIKIEESVGKKRIDLYAINSERRIEIFIENQVGPSDSYNHQMDKVTPLINNISEGYVLWIAEKFQQKHIDGIKQLLQDSPHKYINFYAIELQPDVKKRIASLNTCYPLDIWDKLDSINEIEEKLKVVDDYLWMPDTHLGRTYVGGNSFDFESDYDIKKYLMETFCRKVPNFLSFHYSKKDLKYSKQLTFGAGIGNITYFCSIPSKKRKAVVIGIRFERCLSSAYQHFCEKEELLRKSISPTIYFRDDKRTINYSIESDGYNIPVIAGQLAEVFEKFIFFFSPYIYGGKIKDISQAKDTKDRG